MPVESVFDQIGSALADPGPSQTTDTTASTSTADTSTTDTTSTAGATTDAAPATTETTKVEDKSATSDANTDATVADPTKTEVKEDNPYDVDPSEELPKPTLDAVLATPRGKEIYQGYKTLREINKEIGHIPTVEQAKEYYGAYRDRQIMDHHLNSGDEKGAQTFIQFALGTQRGKGAEIVASHLANTLSSTNPDAYVAASLPFIGNYATALWQRWETEPDGPGKEDLYRVAQMVHHDLTGKWKSLGELGQPTQNGTAPQADPLADERRSLEQERNQINQARQADQQALQQKWEGSLVGSIRDGLVAELDKALAPLKAAYEGKPKLYEALRRDFHDTVVNTARSTNKHAWDLYQVRLAEARQLGTQEAVQNMAKEYLKLATPAIMANRKKFLEEAGAVVNDTSNKRHAELRSIDSQKGLNGSGAPPTPGAGAPLTRNVGETQQDFNLRQLRA